MFEYPPKIAEAHGAIIRAARHYVAQRGWAVLTEGRRCHDCHAHIDTDEHAEHCDYDRLVQAVDALTDIQVRQLRGGPTEPVTSGRHRDRRRRVSPVMADLSYRSLAVAVLVAHQRRDVGSCLCGWSELGNSHAQHVAAVLDAVGALRDHPPKPT